LPKKLAPKIFQKSEKMYILKKSSILEKRKSLLAEFILTKRKASSGNI